ncbi:mannose-1-phosphate guanylyltransferase/mannose-6-phosphate isomerase [Legionella sp. CNM-4043-24]|uniref:mannose-1-phosphate guanylyltransferase/mannose-6-phosphate isomerase n=1 Tax=Legionella sp. CNM-4043-24 TaxID=3421646 RepID=UPI00403AF0BC
MRLIPIILCGGAGSRLWPVSRERHPKPFIRLNDGQSLLQKTFLRGAFASDAEEIITVTNRELYFKSDDEFREVNHAGLALSFILEPFGRNTAAAIAAAALEVNARYGDDALMLVLPADHLISDLDAFSLAVDEAVLLAGQGRLVTFGIQPERPETGYGYIESEGNRVLSFVEKPSLDVAQQFLASGRYLWNSGMFCFQAGRILEEMHKHCPEIISATQTCIELSRRASGSKFNQLELDPVSFALVPENSIDYAVIEKSNEVAVVPCRIGWSDIGSWNALSALSESDANGNQVEAEALLYHVSNCYIRSNERLVGAVGIDNLLIIDTPDALLVADKSRDQEVKRIYAQLKLDGHEAHQLHRTVHRPWGTYTVLEEGPRYKIKRIEVKPGASLSLQMHHHRSEHWIVVSGMAKIVNGEQDVYISTNQSTYIPAGHKHRLENPGILPLIMIEVQSGEYMGEDDIVRFQDEYGRS